MLISLWPCCAARCAIDNRGRVLTDATAVASCGYGETKVSTAMVHESQ